MTGWPCLDCFLLLLLPPILKAFASCRCTPTPYVKAFHVHAHSRSMRHFVDPRFPVSLQVGPDPSLPLPPVVSTDLSQPKPQSCQVKIFLHGRCLLVE